MTQPAPDQNFYFIHGQSEEARLQIAYVNGTTYAKWLDRPDNWSKQNLTYSQVSNLIKRNLQEVPQTVLVELMVDLLTR